MSGALTVTALTTLAILLWPQSSAMRWVRTVRATGEHAEPGSTTGSRRREVRRIDAGRAIDATRSLLARPGRRRPDLLRARSAAEREGPELVESLAAALRAGLPPAAALDAVRSALPDPSLLDPPSEAARSGHSVAAAWGRVARDTGSADVAMVARAWAVSERSGCAVADGLTLAAAAGRARRDVRRVITAATAGARASSSMLTLLPVAGLALGTTMGQSPAQIYGHPVALISLGMGLLVLLAGRRVVRRMVEHVEATQ